MASKEGMKKYVIGEWKGRPNYACPDHPHFKTLNATILREHIRGHAKSRKKKAKSDSKPSEKAPAKKKKKGGNKK